MGGLNGSREKRVTDNNERIRASINGLGQRIKSARLAIGYTQIQLAHVACISLSSLENFEYGHNRPSFESILALSDALNVSPNYLLGYEVI
ncbi:helix-turn-helix domain-containing protein [Phyllobacterium sp. TAF24]|uniref:helix-turn-helix domain-containing protein n=1 Tax=Phyllobacterium sp. TAF24 TaxID=3233068 RepID=UPI003F9D0604